MNIFSFTRYYNILFRIHNKISMKYLLLPCYLAKYMPYMTEGKYRWKKL